MERDLVLNDSDDDESEKQSTLSGYAEDSEWPPFVEWMVKPWKNWLNTSVTAGDDLFPQIKCKVSGQPNVRSRRESNLKVCVWGLIKRIEWNSTNANSLTKTFDYCLKI